MEMGTRTRSSPAGPRVDVRRRPGAVGGQGGQKDRWKAFEITAFTRSITVALVMTL